MTEQQALDLIAQVEQETDLVDAVLIPSDGNGNNYKVRLTLLSKRLTITSSMYGEWSSIKAAWSKWLPGVTLDDLPKPKPPRYLVDGIPMNIREWKQGWFGNYQVNGKPYKKYLGKEDPRGKYLPLFEGEVGA